MPTEAGPDRRRRRWLVPSLASVGLAIGAGLAVAALDRGSDDEGEVKTAVVALGTVEATVTAMGSLQPKDYVDVGAQVSGQLMKVHVEIGDTVAPGTLLAEIDPRVYATKVKGGEAKLAGLEAERRQRSAELKLKRQELERARRLFASKAVSESALQSAETAVETGAAQIDMLEAQIREARATLEGDQANLGFTKIYAPIGGTVVSNEAVEGQTLNTNQSAPTIVRVADLATMTVWAKVAEADINRLRPGMEAWFTTLGMPERRFSGTVTQILPTPETTNDVVLYNVLIDVPNPEGLLMTSMTVQAFFSLARAENVPVVPLEAVRPRAGGAMGERVVRVVTPEGPIARQVELGVQSRTTAEVRAGIEVGEEVVLGTGDTGGGARAQR